MAENNIDYERRAQEVLTPKQRVMSESKAIILGPLDRTGLSEEEKVTVAKYADKVGELAGQELDRLQTESPLKQIIAAMEKYLPDDGSWMKKLEGIQSVARIADKWQSAVIEEQGLALLQRKQATQQEVVKSLFDQQSPYNAERLPTGAIVFATEDSSQDDLNNLFLHDLGVLPDGANVNTLFKLPANYWNFKNNIDVINQAIQDGRPTRIIDGNTIIGLKSDQLPGVQFRVDRYINRLTTSVIFTPEAITRSITNIPGVRV